MEPDLRAAQARALDHLVRVRGMRLTPFPADVHAEFVDAFAIWSAMVGSAKQPSFRYPPQHA